MKPYLETIKRIKLKAGYVSDYQNGTGKPVDTPEYHWAELWSERKTRMRRKQARAIDKQHKAKYLGGRQSHQYRFLSRNTSLWCTPLIELVIDFVVKELKQKGGRASTYNMQFVHTNRGGHGRARLDGSWVHIAHDRNAPRMNWKYCGISWAKDHATKTGLQSLCHIIAHELVHTTNLANAKYKNGRRQLQSMEFKTDNIAGEVVSAFAKEEIKIWRKYRKLRRTARNKNLRKENAKAERKAPNRKLELAEMNLVKWQKKLEQAESKVKSYQTKVNRLVAGRKRSEAHQRKVACKAKGQSSNKTSTS